MEMPCPPVLACYTPFSLNSLCYKAWCDSSKGPRAALEGHSHQPHHNLAHGVWLLNSMNLAIKLNYRHNKQTQLFKAGSKKLMGN